MSTGQSPSAPVELAFRTPPELELLGLDTSSPEPALWVRAAPEMAVRWSGETAWTPVGALPVRLSGQPRDLEVRAGEGAPAKVAVTAPLPADAPLDLGVLVGPEPEKERVDGQPLTEWLAAHRFGWIVLPPAGDGKPLRAPAPPGLRTIRSVKLPASDRREAWLKELRAVLPPGAAHHVAIDAEWMYSAGMGTDFGTSTDADAALAAEIRAWRGMLEREYPGSALLVPAPLGLVQAMLRSELQEWLRALGTLDTFSLETLSDGENFERDRTHMYRGLEKQGMRVDVRFIWMMSAIRAELLEACAGGRTTDSVGPVRCFTFARATYPGAVVLLDLRELAGIAPARATVPTWQRLEAVARALRGTRFRKRLRGDGTDTPRIDAKAPLNAFAFTGPAHGVQVLCTETRPVPIRFTPARPGWLRTPGPATAPWSSRLIGDLAPIDLEVTSAPLVYEELVKVRASTSSAAFEVTVR